MEGVGWRRRCVVQACGRFAGYTHRSAAAEWSETQSGFANRAAVSCDGRSHEETSNDSAVAGAMGSSSVSSRSSSRKSDLANADELRADFERGMEHAASGRSAGMDNIVGDASSTSVDQAEQTEPATLDRAQKSYSKEEVKEMVKSVLKEQ